MQLEDLSDSGMVRKSIPRPDAQQRSSRRFLDSSAWGKHFEKLIIARAGRGASLGWTGGDARPSISIKVRFRRPGRVRRWEYRRSLRIIPAGAGSGHTNRWKLRRPS